jgi:hypothetical protein
MAKVSRVNVAITGDARGLATATDQATRDLRRLEIAAERTKQRLNSMRGTTNQTAESLGKLGVQSRALGAVSGVLGLGALGGAGLALGAAGLAGTAAIAAGGAVLQGVQNAPSQRMKALDALRQSRETGVDISTLGVSRAVAEKIAMGRQSQTVAEQLSVSEAFSQGLATGGGKSMTEFLINQAPKTFALQVGSRLAGATEQEAATFAASSSGMGSAGETISTVMGWYHSDDLIGRLARWWSK